MGKCSHPHAWMHFTCFWEAGHGRAEPSDDGLRVAPHCLRFTPPARPTRAPEEGPRHTARSGGAHGLSTLHADVSPTPLCSKAPVRLEEAWRRLPGCPQGRTAEALLWALGRSLPLEGTAP